MGHRLTRFWSGQLITQKMLLRSSFRRLRECQKGEGTTIDTLSQGTLYRLPFSIVSATLQHKEPVFPQKPPCPRCQSRNRLESDLYKGWGCILGAPYTHSAYNDDDDKRGRKGEEEGRRGGGEGVISASMYRSKEDSKSVAESALASPSFLFMIEISPGCLAVKDRQGLVVLRTARSPSALRWRGR